MSVPSAHALGLGFDFLGVFRGSIHSTETYLSIDLMHSRLCRGSSSVRTLYFKADLDLSMVIKCRHLDR